MNWIKVQTNLRTSPKLVRVASALKWTPVQSMGAVITCWMLADEHASETGLLEGLNFSDINLMVSCPGLAEAMACVGWLKETARGVQYVNYEEHNGSTAKSRAREQKRKAVSRKCPQKSGQKADKTRTREKKRREEKNKPLHNNSNITDQQAMGGDQVKDLGDERDDHLKDQGDQPGDHQNDLNDHQRDERIDQRGDQRDHLTDETVKRPNSANFGASLKGSVQNMADDQRNDLNDEPPDQRIDRRDDHRDQRSHQRNDLNDEKRMIADFVNRTAKKLADAYGSRPELISQEAKRNFYIEQKRAHFTDEEVDAAIDYIFYQLDPHLELKKNISRVPF